MSQPNSISVEWIRGLAFRATTPSGHVVHMDASEESGGENSAPSPIEVVVTAVATCSGMDVISILHKQRQQVTAYRIEIEWTRVEPGTFPRPITSLRLVHVVTGVGLNPDAVRRAVMLSDEKYCSVIATLRQSPHVVSDFRIETPQ